MEFMSRFGFSCIPFTREIATDQCFALPAHDEAVSELESVVDLRMIAAVINPPGTGKSTCLRRLHDRLPEARYRTSYIKVTGLSKRDLCREIAEALGLPPAGSYPTLVRRLQEGFLNIQETDGLRPVLLLDEGHDLRPEGLSILRLLTNFEMDSRLVLSIVLCGQPPLARLLKRAAFEDIARRITHYVTLPLLTREETMRYVRHRCTIAGARTVPFDARSLDALYEIGRGNLRLTDSLALKALQVAHKENCETADANHVAAARRLACL
jgi:type II secretory pathway predicted ATPase ExeA